MTKCSAQQTLNHSGHRRHMTDGALVNEQIKCVMKQMKISRLEDQKIQKLFKTKVVVLRLQRHSTV